ncbi:MAG: sulfotransferase [Chitinophagales bacterium]
MVKDKAIFIVGNSRSGTTMMLRILNNHSQVYGLNELHFFEQLWSSADKDKEISKEEAITLAAKLLFVQRDGYIGTTDAKKYKDEATTLVDEMITDKYLGHDVYTQMIFRETALQNKQFPCEKTPQNVFYLKEILDIYPNGRVINMIRDPRAVMLSQKRKWRRRKMGATFITKREVIRLRINYHPITISKLWNAAIKAAEPFEDDERVMNVHFEDIMDAPVKTTQKICEHLEISYEEGMLDIPQASSSNEADSDEKGINKKRAGNWKKGGLNDAEIFWNQKISGDLLNRYNYSLEPVKSNIFSKMAYAISFPVKLAFALLLNLNRMKNIGETLKRRLK